MPSNTPVIYLIAGCNGVGKTTFAKAFLPQEAKCLNFLNADLIAAGIAPLNSQAAQLKAGRLRRISAGAFIAACGIWFTTTRRSPASGRCGTIKAVLRNFWPHRRLVLWTN